MRHHHIIHLLSFQYPLRDQSKEQHLHSTLYQGNQIRAKSGSDMGADRTADLQPANHLPFGLLNGACAGTMTFAPHGFSASSMAALYRRKGLEGYGESEKAPLYQTGSASAEPHRLTTPAQTPSHSQATQKGVNDNAYTSSPDEPNRSRYTEVNH